MRQSIIIFCLLLLGIQVQADELYKVKKGDTLWDICEQYYHDPFLWPKLWQINPQVTNPHWIYPGDVLILKETPEELIKVTEKKGPCCAHKKEKKAITLDARFIEAAGYLLPYQEKHSGEIIKAVGEERTILGKGDKIFVKFTDGITPQVGSTWTIFRISPPVNHPISGKKIGYIHEILGVARITKVYPQVAEARIIRSYDVIYKGSYLKPYQPVKPVSLSEDSQTHLKQRAFIVSSRNRVSEIGAPEVVYIDVGENQGVKTGQILKVFRKEKQDLPLLPVGEILIIYTTPRTATAMVLKSQYPFHPGDIVE